MPRPLLLPAVMALSLAACSRPPPPPLPPVAASAAAPVAPVAVAAAEVAPTAMPASASAPTAAQSVAATPSGATITGAIRDGNRAPPALRVCAHPVGGGAPTCTETATGADAYRIEVAPGRYYLMGWVQGGELVLLAHASQIRCIQAPCPPDELIEVEVAEGDEKAGIDLSGGYVDVPQGWPSQP